MLAPGEEPSLLPLPQDEAAPSPMLLPAARLPARATAAAGLIPSRQPLEPASRRSLRPARAHSGCTAVAPQQLLGPSAGARPHSLFLLPSFLQDKEVLLFVPTPLLPACPLSTPVPGGCA